MLESFVATYPDLSPYAYHPRDVVSARDGHASWVPDHPRVNVGWLGLTPEGLTAPWTTGNTSPDFVERLLDVLTEQQVNRMRGFHWCELCPRPDRAEFRMPEFAYGHRKFSLGNGEIRVPGRHGEVFAAPTLLPHYVTVHGYLPPEPFVRAVLEYPRGWLAGLDAPGIPAYARVTFTR